MVLINEWGPVDQHVAYAYYYKTDYYYQQNDTGKSVKNYWAGTKKAFDVDCFRNGAEKTLVKPGRYTRTC